ncbi:Ca-activated chloride channel homolog [Hyphomicrobium sp. 1Nfss2.1]|uniref:vWA domain-containing protein n=1 Tax=Hyphomicrobium sp. 1Nfss2.1 TaxID=3413936 RepID=UPI003C7A442D
MGPLLLLRSAAVLLLALVASGAAAQSTMPPSCRDDAMIVFDASGSMSGTDFNTPPTPRIDKVRQALAKVLPQIAAMRNLGLIDYGPGPSNRCDNIELLLQPAPRSADRIMAALSRLNPAGRTPLTAAVREAARVLRFPEKPGVVVLLTDGEETCGGDPCAMAKALRAEGENLTIHVIGYRMRELATTNGYVQSRCMTDSTGGLYISVETSEQLVEALQKTLGCPAVSDASLGHTGR